MNPETVLPLFFLLNPTMDKKVLNDRDPKQRRHC